MWWDKIVSFSWALTHLLCKISATEPFLEHSVFKLARCFPGPTLHSLIWTSFKINFCRPFWLHQGLKSKVNSWLWPLLYGFSCLQGSTPLLHHFSSGIQSYFWQRYTYSHPTSHSYKTKLYKWNYLFLKPRLVHWDIGSSSISTSQPGNLLEIVLNGARVPGSRMY